MILLAQPLSQPNAFEVAGFCLTCPPPQEVAALLQPLGFRLVFQMEATIYPAYAHTPDLPAQYHYKDPFGTEVIYLAGQDSALDGERLPRHASRFWLSPGADLLAYRRVARLLATTWPLTWKPSHGENALVLRFIA
ncbi:MAG TPA: hypothetical protein VKV40_22555 [Ktedonobacteraceae bacterium]|nr:hypothetical protein [Ktedonobacteraceae bacterium]